MTSRARFVALVLVFGLVAAACRRPPPAVELGIQRIALSLSFSEEELVVPIEPEVIIRYLPAPPDVLQPIDIVRYQVPTDAPFTPPVYEPRPAACPEAPPGASPARPVQLQIVLPPKEGRYERFNTGSMFFNGGLIALKFPFPRTSFWDVIHLPDIVTTGVEGVTEDTAQKTWKIRKVMAPGFEVTDTYLLTATQFNLQSRETLVNGVVNSFVPTPTINLFVFGNEGDTWVSSGVDAASNTAMVVSGAIIARESVDACGTLVDTYQFTLDEQIVNLETGETTGTPAGEPNTYNIANHLGGLFIREDIHTVQSTSTEDGTPLTIELDYVSTVGGIEPEPIP